MVKENQTGQPANSGSLGKLAIKACVYFVIRWKMSMSVSVWIYVAHHH